MSEQTGTVGLRQHLNSNISGLSAFSASETNSSPGMRDSLNSNSRNRKSNVSSIGGTDLAAIDANMPNIIEVDGDDASDRGGEERNRITSSSSSSTAAGEVGERGSGVDRDSSWGSDRESNNSLQNPLQQTSRQLWQSDKGPPHVAGGTGNYDHLIETLADATSSPSQLARKRDRIKAAATNATATAAGASSRFVEAARPFAPTLPG